VPPAPRGGVSPGRQSASGRSRGNANVYTAACGAKQESTWQSQPTLKARPRPGTLVPASARAVRQHHRAGVTLALPYHTLPQLPGRARVVRQHQRVAHELRERRGRRHGVVLEGGRQAAVLWVVDHRGRQRVEAQHVGQAPVCTA